MELVTVCG